MSHKNSVLYETFRELITEIFSCQWSKKNAFFFRFRTYILFYKVRFEKIVGQFSCSTYPPITILGENLSTPIEKNNQKNQMYRFFIKYNTFEYTLVFLASPQLRYEMSRFHIEHPVYYYHINANFVIKLLQRE